MSERVEHLAAPGNDSPRWTVRVYEPEEGAWEQSSNGLPGWLNFQILDPYGDDEGGAEDVGRGFVKWDGCAHYYFDGYVHADGFHSVQPFAVALVRAYEIACDWMQVEDGLRR